MNRKLAALSLDDGAKASLLAQMQGPLCAGSVFFARVRHIIDPHNFYVLPLKNEKILPDLEKPGQPCSSIDLEIGKIVVYKKKEMDSFKRGLIRDKSDDKMTLFAMDSGYIEQNVDIKFVFLPHNAEACLAPPLALKCELYLCEPRGSPVFTELVIDAFKHFMGLPNEKLRIKVHSTNQLKLKVIVQNSYPDDVATLLAITEYTQFASVLYPRINRRVPQPINTYPWKFKTLDVGQTLTVRVQHGSCFSEMFVCTVDDYKDYCQNLANFASYCRSQNEISEQDFKVNTSVGVMMDSHTTFERAVIDRILVPNHEAKVRLVDWGNVITVTKNKVRPINTELFSMTPIRAFYCYALNGHEWISKLPMSLCKGYQYKMTVKKIGSEFVNPYIVTLDQAM